VSPSGESHPKTKDLTGSLLDVGLGESPRPIGVASGEGGHNLQVIDRGSGCGLSRAREPQQRRELGLERQLGSREAGRTAQGSHLDVEARIRSGTGSPIARCRNGFCQPAQRLDGRRRKSTGRESGGRARNGHVVVPEISEVVEGLRGKIGLARGLDEARRLGPNERTPTSASTRLDEALSAEDVERLAQRDVRHPEARRQGSLARQTGPHGEDAGDDRLADLAGDRLHSVAIREATEGNPLGDALYAHLSLGAHHTPNAMSPPPDITGQRLRPLECAAAASYRRIEPIRPKPKPPPGGSSPSSIVGPSATTAAEELATEIPGTSNRPVGRSPRPNRPPLDAPRRQNRDSASQALS
jgi:hypothetical protein